MLRILIGYVYDLIRIILIGVMIEKIVLAAGYAFTEFNAEGWTDD